MKREDEKRDRAGDRAGKPSALQTVSHGMSFWFLVSAIGLAVLFLGSLYFGLFAVASTFGSILLVSITLYVFFRFWPEEEPVRPSRGEPSLTPKPREAVAEVVEGPPKARFMTALRDASRRQENFRISKQGAERFAKTIRYLLRSQPD